MSIEQKYLQQDKNYLLKTVQAFGKESFLDEWTVECYKSYMTLENPLGLEDDFTITIKSEIRKGAFILNEAYDILAAIYRLKKGDNQLSFVWDGRTHMEYYDEKWRAKFGEWIIELSQKREIYRSVIKASLADKTTITDFLHGSIRRTLLGHFNTKLTRTQKLYALAG